MRWFKEGGAQKWRGNQNQRELCETIEQKGNAQLDETQQNIWISVQHFGGRALLDERLHCKVEDGRCVLFGLELEFAEIVDKAVEKLGLEQLMEETRGWKKQNEPK
jgi:hypothetical protein